MIPQPGMDPPVFEAQLLLQGSGGKPESPQIVAEVRLGNRKVHGLVETTLSRVQGLPTGLQHNFSLVA